MLAGAGARGVGACVAGSVAVAHARWRLALAALRMQQDADCVAGAALQPRHAVAVARMLRGPVADSATMLARRCVTSASPSTGGTH